MSSESDVNVYHMLLELAEDLTDPNHYELLGLPPFAEGEARIRNAAADQTNRLLKWQSSEQYWPAADDLMSMVADVRDKLLDAESKRRYDAELRAKLGLPAKPIARRQVGAGRPPPAARTRRDRPAELLGLSMSSPGANHYEVLGLPPFEADSAAILHAVQSRGLLLLKWLDGEDSEQREAARKLDRRLNEAAQILLNEMTKGHYDEKLRSSPKPDGKAAEVAGVKRGRTTADAAWPPNQRPGPAKSLPTTTNQPAARGPGTSSPRGTQPAPSKSEPSASKALETAKSFAVSRKIAFDQVEPTSVLNNLGALLKERSAWKKALPETKPVYRPSGIAPPKAVLALAASACLGAAIHLGVYGITTAIFGVNLDSLGRFQQNGGWYALAFGIGSIVACVEILGVGAGAGTLVGRAGIDNENRNPAQAASWAFLSCVLGTIALAVFIYVSDLRYRPQYIVINMVLAALTGLVAAAVASELTRSSPFCEKCLSRADTLSEFKLRYSAARTLVAACRAGNWLAAIGAVEGGFGRDSLASLKQCPRCKSGYFDVTVLFARKYKAENSTQTSSQTWIAYSGTLEPPVANQMAIALSRSKAYEPAGADPRKSPTANLKPAAEQANESPPRTPSEVPVAVVAAGAGGLGNSGPCPKCNRRAWWDGRSCGWCDYEAGAAAAASASSTGNPLESVDPHDARRIMEALSRGEVIKAMGIYRTATGCDAESAVRAGRELQKYRNPRR